MDFAFHLISQTADVSDAEHVLHGSTHDSANTHAFANDSNDIVKSKSNLRKRQNHLQDSLSDTEDGVLYELSDEIDNTLSELRHYNLEDRLMSGLSDEIDKTLSGLLHYNLEDGLMSGLLDEIGNALSILRPYSHGDIENAPEAFRASALALSQIKDSISNSGLIKSLPIEFQPMLSTMLQELSIVDTHLNKIERLISKFYISDESKLDTITGVSRRRVLSSAKSSPTIFFYDPVVTQADYHLRVRSPNMQTHHSSIDKTFGHQQGYHGARHTRSNGGTHRRLAGDSSTCVNVNIDERKKEQCLRLAECARNYNLYDMFVYFFGDDIDFDTGLVGEDEKISVYDEIELAEKVRIVMLNTICFNANACLPSLKILNDFNARTQRENIIKLSGDIFAAPLNITNFIVQGQECDQLLQEFHRFDEELSVKGKWQGGTVTGVCRGWGTSKVRISMGQITGDVNGPVKPSETHSDLVAL